MGKAGKHPPGVGQFNSGKWTTPAMERLSRMAPKWMEEFKWLHVKLLSRPYLLLFIALFESVVPFLLGLVPETRTSHGAGCLYCRKAGLSSAWADGLPTLYRELFVVRKYSIISQSY